MRSPTAAAVAPPMPASISSKISAAGELVAHRASATTSASRTRESSPPEATRASGLGAARRHWRQRETRRDRAPPDRCARARSDRDLEAPRSQRELAELARARVCRAPCAPLPQLRRAMRRPFELARRIARFAARALGDALVAAFVLLDVGRAPRRAASSAPSSDSAVLALQPLEQFEPRVDRFELGGIELRRFERARDVGRELAGLALQRRRALRHRAAARRRTSRSPRSAAAAAPSASVAPGSSCGERLPRGAQRRRDALDVVEKAAPLREPLVLAGIDARLVDLARR